MDIDISRIRFAMLKTRAKDARWRVENALNRCRDRIRSDEIVIVIAERATRRISVLTPVNGRVESRIDDSAVNNHAAVQHAPPHPGHTEVRSALRTHCLLARRSSTSREDRPGSSAMSTPPGLMDNRCKETAMHDRKKITRVPASRSLGAVLLLAAMALPGAAMAVDGKIGTSQYYSRLAADVNGKKYRIAELPVSWYAGRPNCATAAANGTLKSTPYVASFVGGGGNFGNTDPGNAGRNDYYQKKMMDMAASLSVNGNCVRVVSIETAFVAEGGYDNYVSYFNDGFFGATMSGSSQVYWPMSKGASAEFAITLAIQREANYSTAARWYLHGGSGSAMHSARLLDMLNDGAVAAYAYKIPEATILESLPISGDMLEVCRNVNALSSADRIISSIYAGYETANTCSVVRANPSLYNYKVNTTAIRDWYVTAKAKSIYVMMGANDPLWKETLDKTDPGSGGSLYYVSPTTTGWAALGVYRNFLATISVAESSCTNRSANVFDASHASFMYNSYQKADCGAGGRIKIRQYQYGGHGPLSNFTIGAIPAGERNAMDQMRVWLF